MIIRFLIFLSIKSAISGFGIREVISTLSMITCGEDAISPNNSKDAKNKDIEDILIFSGDHLYHIDYLNLLLSST
ncbi:hypothetical protein L2E82_32023 [Cichorium intybus]|uniref:Uncharacterized protein n=1 Tax=Cichorium intybus TaxID=13427 RepID=A0ACB9BGU9_CICIN|nr:hypothetical protein L2E82_32023 [Cichorium intybus]